MPKGDSLNHGARLIMLRAAVGLDNPTDEDPPGLLAEWLRPGIKDLLFVSVDIEGKEDSSDSQSDLGYIFHCGISVLDTRALCDYARAFCLARADAATPKPAAPELDSYHFSIGDNTNEINKPYLDGRRRKFPFHAEHHPMASSAIARIYEILGDRPFVLVVHGGTTDYRFWKTFRIGREPLWTINTGCIVGHCYPHAFKPSTPPKLKTILNFLRIPYGDGELHIAGFDAHYTLRALLIIAADCANTTKLKEAFPSDFDWLSIQLALVSIGGGSSARGIDAKPWRPKKTSKDVPKRLSKTNRPPFSLRASVKPRARTQKDARLVRRLVRAVKRSLRSNNEENHDPAYGHDKIVTTVEATMDELNITSLGSPPLDAEAVTGLEVAVSNASGGQKGKPPNMQGMWDSGYDDEAEQGGSLSTELLRQPRTVWRQSPEPQPACASQLRQSAVPPPGESIPGAQNASRPRNPYGRFGEGAERLHATASIVREGPGIFRLTTGPSDAAVFPAASGPTLQAPAGEGHSGVTGLGNESKAMQGFPSVGPAGPRRKDQYEVGTSYWSLPLTAGIGADYKAPQKQPHPYAGDLSDGPSDGVLTHGLQEQSQRFIGVDCHPDPVRTADPVHRQEDVSAIPGKIQLVPAGPHMLSLNALTDVRPQSPVKRLKQLAKGSLGPVVIPQDPASQNPKLQVSRVTKLKQVVKDTLPAFPAVKDKLPSLPVINQLRRSHKRLLRAMRNFEDANKTGAEEFQSLVELDTLGDQTGEPGALTAPGGVLSSTSNTSGSQARVFGTPSAGGRALSSKLTTSPLDEALDAILEAPVSRTMDKTVEGEAKL